MENKNYVPPIFLSSFIKIQYMTVTESNAIPSCDSINFTVGNHIYFPLLSRNILLNYFKFGNRYYFKVFPKFPRNFFVSFATSSKYSWHFYKISG